jgi:hypothetical protein
VFWICVIVGLANNFDQNQEKRMKKPTIYRFVKAPRFEIVKPDNIPRNSPLWVRYHDVKNLISGPAVVENESLKELVGTLEEAAACHLEERGKLVKRCEEAEKQLQATEIELTDAKKINAETAENPGILLERAVKAEEQLSEAELKIAKLEKIVADSKATPPKKPKAKGGSKSK